MNPTFTHFTVAVVIPAYNEEKSIGKVVQAIPQGLVRDMIVVNNGSTDSTAEVARQAGAIVVDQPKRGYGNACLAGIGYLQSLPTQPDVLVFLDGDFSDYPEEMTGLLLPIADKGMDLVIGSRVTGVRESGSMMPQQVFGNWLATSLLKLLYGVRFTDLGPFRAIRFSRLLELQMQDTTYGWTVEMQAKAAKQGLKCCEVPVNYRRRIGVSKVSGTIKGTFMAGYKILWTIFKYS